MSQEQQRVSVRLAGACDNRTGQGWVYVLRNGTESRTMYPTGAEARKAGERALKRMAK